MHASFQRRCDWTADSFRTNQSRVVSAGLVQEGAMRLVELSGEAGLVAIFST